MRNKVIRALMFCLIVSLTLGFPLTASASGPELVSGGAEDGSLQSVADSSTPEPPAPVEGKYVITIAAPRGWYTKTATATIKVDDVNQTGFEKTEVKHGSDGRWQDISDALRAYGSATVELSDNGTVYVAVTDLTGKAHMRSLYIECFDREVPTVRAKIEGRTLRIEADDSLSGVAAVYVNGYDLDDLTNGTLDVRVKEYADKDYADILIYAVDYAGNKSKTVSVKNPYYEAESSQSSSQSASSQAASSPSASSQSASEAQSSSASSAPAASAPAATSAPAASSAPAQTAQATQPAESSAADSDNGSVTPTDGTGSVIENSVKTPEQREFFTITTERGNDYYIVVDKEKSDKNVYLLSEVTEEDLVGLTKQSEPAASEPDIPPVVTPTPAPEPESPTITEPTPEPEPEAQPSNNTGQYVMVAVLVLAFGAAAYYFKIVRPKQNPVDPDEDEGEDEDDYPEYGGNDGDIDYGEDDGYGQDENGGEGL